MTRDEPHMQDQHLVLWDGDCGFCGNCVDWIEQRDHGDLFDCRPYQSLTGPPMTPALAAACDKAVHVLTREGETLRAGRAMLFITQQLGWRQLSSFCMWPPMIWIVEAGYVLVANNRQFFSRLLFRAG